MKYLNIKLLIVFIILLVSCSKYKGDFRYIKISTEKGDILLRLSNLTPKHRDNFIKLSSSKFYDNQIFHRVIQDFVIQGGDPSTKNAKPDSLYGEKDSGYLIDAEFNDSLFHTRGAIGMARQGDDTNPEKKSSGSQFYIVKGKIYTDQQLDELIIKKNNQFRNKLLRELITKKLSSQPINKIDSVEVSLQASIELDSIWESYPKFFLTPKQRKLYTTIGGIPHLDRNYTVFGEVISGFEVVDMISASQTDKNDRPLKDIKFKVTVLK